MTRSSDKLLMHRQVKPTAMRTLIIDQLKENDEAMSLQDIEDVLPNADKVTIYRTIKTFIDNDVVHAIVLPDGNTKYALCKLSCNHHHIHPHFTCSQCGMTCCLSQIQMQLEDVPKSYKISEAMLNLVGVCPKCQ